MSKILKGLNESTHNKYDNNRTGFSRGPRDDERHDLDAQKPAREEWALKINGKVWSKDGKTVTFASKEQALKARQSLLAKRPELEVGLVTRSVSEGLLDDDIQTRMRMNDYYDLADAIQEKLRQAIQIGNKELIQKYSKERDELDARITKYGLMPESDQLDELSNNKLGQYKTAAASDAGKADSEGDYKRADKRFGGIVKATKKQFANDTKKSGISQGINELEGDIETFTAPTTNKPPSHGFAIKVHGPLGTGPRLNGIPAVTLWEGLSAVFPDKYPPKDYQNIGAQYDSPQAKVFNQIQRAGSAVVASGIASRDLAETLAHKLATYKPTSPDYEGIGPIGKKFVEVIEQGMDEATEQSIDPFKHVNPRVNNPKILGTQNRAKSAYYPPSKPPVKKLDKPLPESLGDNLPSKSLQALMQAKHQNEKQRMADLEQWEKDFKQNTASKFIAREPNLRQRVTSTPMVAMPGEKHSELKARLSQLNKAIEKQGILDNLVQKLDKKGLLTPNIEAGVDTSMLVRDGARDNYVELNRKLDKALEYVKNRLLTNKAAYAKPKAIDEEQLDELKCWSGYHRVAGTKAGFPGSCAKNKTNEEDLAEQSNYDWSAEKEKIRSMSTTQRREYALARLEQTNDDKFAHIASKAGAGHSEIMNAINKGRQGVAEEQHSCPHCGGEMVSEELMNEKKDACYYKVKSRYKVWPSAYASGALVKCRKSGADSWGNGGKKNESSILEGIEQADESLHDWFNKEKWVRMDTKGKIKGPCAREPGEGKPKCLPQSKAHSLGKKGRASAAQRKRREDPNPERSGKAINVDTKKSKG